MKKLFALPLLCLVLINPLIGQDKEYPIATPTDQPDIVISPYDSTRRLDVEGLDPGSLAEDPIAKKIFRVPFSNPTKRYYDDYLGNKPSNDKLPPPPISSGSSQVIPPPPIDRAPSQPRVSQPEPSGPNSPSWIPENSQMPNDLLNFIYAFNQNSTVNDADALLPFYADRVDNYFGRRNLSKSSIRSDRSSYIKKFPQREYILQGPPVLLGIKGDVYEVMTRVRYAVVGGGRTRTGEVSDYFKIRRGSRKFEIISINEAKASAAPESITQEDNRRIQTESPINSHAGQGTVYSRFEIEQISLFLDALAASGEVNEPSAMIDFMHPQATQYYDKRNPSMSQLLKDRRDYINRWPERRYWLAEKPVITPLSSGAWSIVSKTGYEVKNGSKVVKGVDTSDLRVTHTPAGLKVLSIKSRK